MKKMTLKSVMRKSRRMMNFSVKPPFLYFCTFNKTVTCVQKENEITYYTCI